MPPTKKTAKKKPAIAKAKPPVTRTRKSSPRKGRERLLAEQMFVSYQMTAKAIAETLDLQEKTVGKWRDEDGWDKKRDEFFANPVKIRQVLLSELFSVASGEPAAIDADALSKITKALDTLSDKISPEVVVGVMQMLDNFLAEYNPQLAVDCLDPHKAFIHHIISINGS